jgi:hypothetical protein
VLRYLSGTKSLGLTFRKDSKMPTQMFTDNNWGGDGQCLSTAGWVMMICGAAVAWACKKQRSVSIKSADNIADIMTKILGKKVFSNLVKMPMGNA